MGGAQRGDAPAIWAAAMAKVLPHIAPKAHVHPPVPQTPDPRRTGGTQLMDCPIGHSQCCAFLISTSRSPLCARLPRSSGLDVVAPSTTGISYLIRTCVQARRRLPPGRTGEPARRVDAAVHSSVPEGVPGRLCWGATGGGGQRGAAASCLLPYSWGGVALEAHRTSRVVRGSRPKRRISASWPWMRIICPRRQAFAPQGVALHLLMR